MKRAIIFKGLIVIFCSAAAPRFALAGDRKPLTALKINYKAINQIIGDTTLPVQDEKTTQRKEEKGTDDKTVEAVKVIPQARRQPIPVPVKVNIQPIKIIKPKIIKTVVKPVIKILH